MLAEQVFFLCFLSWMVGVSPKLSVTKTDESEVDRYVDDTIAKAYHCVIDYAGLHPTAAIPRILGQNM